MAFQPPFKSAPLTAPPGIQILAPKTLVSESLHAKSCLIMFRGWKMSESYLLHPRGYSGSVHLENDTLLITGGGNGETLATSELLDLNHGGSVEGTRLPSKFKYHCACPFNGSHIFIGTGISTDEIESSLDGKQSENALLLNLELGEWFQLPDIITPRFRVNSKQMQTHSEASKPNHIPIPIQRKVFGLFKTLFKITLNCSLSHTHTPFFFPFL